MDPQPPGCPLLNADMTLLGLTAGSAVRSLFKVSDPQEIWEGHSRNRLKFMEAIYQRSGGRARVPMSSVEVFTSAAIRHEDRNDLLSYLLEQGLVSWAGRVRG